VNGGLEDLKSGVFEFETDLEVDLTALSEPDLSRFVSRGIVQTEGVMRGRGGDFQFEGALRSDLVQFLGIPFQGIASEVDLDRDRLEILHSSFMAFGGNAVATGSLYWSETAESTFEVRAERVEIASILRQFDVDQVKIEGQARFQGQFRLPGIEFEEIEGSGEVAFLGELLPLREETLLKPAALSGGSRIELRDRRFRVADGVGVVEQDQAAFEGTVDWDGRYDFRYELQGEHGGRLLRLAELFALLTDEIRQQIPVQAEGPYRIAGGVRDDEGDLQTEGTLEAMGLRLFEYELGTLSAAFHLEGGMIAIEEARLKAPQFTAQTSLRIPLSDQIDLPELRVESSLIDFPVGPFLRVFAPEVEMEGAVSGQVEFRRAETGVFEGQGELSIPRLDVLDHHIEQVEVSLRFQDSRIEVQSVRANLFGGGITGSGSYETVSREVDVELKGVNLDLQQISPLQERVELAGLVEVSAELKGPADRLSGTVAVSSEELKHGDQILREVSLASRIEDNVAHFRLSSRYLTDPFETEGQIGLSHPFPLQAALHFRDLSLRPYLRQLTEAELENFQGVVSGNALISGELSQPSELEVELNLESSRLELAAYSLELNEATRITFRDGRIRIPPLTLSGVDTDLSIAGEIQVTEPQQISMRLEGLANLRLVNGFLDAGNAFGQLRLSVDVVGSLEDPRIVGSAELGTGDMEKGFFMHPSIPTTLFNMEGSLKFTANQISIDSLKARTQYGEVNAEGGIFLDGFVPERWQINVFGYGLRLRYPEEVISLIHVDVDFLRSDGSQLITGVVYVRSAEYTTDISIPQLILNLTRSQLQATAPPTGEEIVLDIDVEAYRSLRINNNLADVTASGDFTVRGTVQNPVILGAITIDEGRLFLENNEYELVRGTINFNNPRRTTPIFNFEAATDVNQYSVTVLVRGPADQLNLSFRSDPPLPTPSVVSLLAIGQTQEEIFGVEGTQQTQSGALALYGAGSLLSKTLGEQLETRTSRLFGFERFSIDPFIDTTRSRDPGARITLGKQITRSLGVTYITNLGSEQRQTVVIEYRVTDWLTAVGTQENDAIAVDFKLRKRF
ncbi:MAG TPA: translocation/assembly module TamB, partial [Acidobacteriota bacterium]|nr:translocation/assembly module TamB [Acidobacteriota bacterium]